MTERRINKPKEIECVEHEVTYLSESEASESAVSKPPSYLSVPQAADLLKVHPALIYREIRSGRLVAVKIGERIIRIPFDSLQAYISEQQTGGR